LFIHILIHLHIPFEWYFNASNSIQVSELESSLAYFVEKQLLDDGTVRLHMSEEFGEQLKRHAYFYFDMLYHTTNEFIRFVDESFEPED
jgi:hypothetical protein